MNDKIKKIIATAVASLGLFVFAACGTDGGSGDNGAGSGGGSSQLPEDGVNGGSDNGNGSNDNNGSDNNNGSGDNSAEKPSEPVIPTVPEGSVKITEAAGDLEAAYVVWDKVAGAMGYNVYIKGESGDYEKLDAPLVREYKDYFRADAVGLKAGEYSLKVVPTGGAELAEDESKAATATQITVLAHDRSGYAFLNGSSSGAYEDDGTLKKNANVIYITDENKHSVKMTVSGAECVGLQAILTAYKKETKPLSVRFIGNIGTLDTAKSDKGDFIIKEINAGITFEGIGSDATANGWGLRVVKSSNVEVRNLGFMNTVGDTLDNIGIQASTYVWVHNCDMFYGGAGGDSDQAKGDGALDTKDNSSNVTHSYIHFWDSGKCNLQGMKKEKTSDCITYHHNWYDHSDSRHPRIRTCTVHVYNNYFDGNAKYGVGVTMGASAFVENNYFRSTATMHPMLSSEQGTDALGDGTFSGETGGMIKAYGNTFDGKYKLITQNDTTDKSNLDCYLATSRDETVPAEYKTKSGSTAYNNFDTASDFYEYTVDTPEVAKEKIEKYAGRIGGGDFKWEFDDETEDANYAVIPELKAALTNYKSDLVKVGGIEVGTPNSGSTGGNGGSTEEGGSTGGTETGPVAGEVSFIPTASGSGFTVTGGTKSHSEIVVAGVTVPKNTALKLDSGGKIEFTTTEIMVLYLYVLNAKTVSVDGNEKTPVAEGGYYVISLELSAGDHTVVKGNGENSVYLIKLVPKTT